MPELNFIRGFKAPTTPWKPQAQISSVVFHKAKEEFLYEPGASSEYLSWIVKGHGITSPKGIEKTIHYDAPVFEDRTPEIGKHFAAMRHPQHVMKTIKIEDKIALRTTFTVLDEVMASFSTPEDFANFMRFEASAAARGLQSYFLYLFICIFGDTTKAQENEFYKQLIEAYKKPTDANSAGVPMAEVIRSVEEVCDSNFKKTAHATDQLKTAILAKLWKNEVTYTKGTNAMDKPIKQFQALIKLLEEMTGEITTQYNVNKDIKEAISTNKSDLIVFMNKSDLIELKELFIEMQHPKYLEITAETLGVKKLIAASYFKKGEFKIIHKDCFNIYFIKNQSGAAEYREHFATNYFTRLSFYAGVFECYPAVVLKPKA